MFCPRCHGLMVNDQVYDPDEAILDLPIWRCVNCGETVDSLILQNRLRNSQESKSAAKKAA